MYNECRHRMPTGLKCHSPALRGKLYCYFHQKQHRVRSSRSIVKGLSVDSLQDNRGIHFALTQVLAAMNSPLMDTRRAHVMLSTLRLASQIVGRISRENAPKSVRTRSTPKQDPVEDNALAVLEILSEVLGREAANCKPPDDCVKCARRETCNGFEDWKEMIDSFEKYLEAEDAAQSQVQKPTP